MFSQPRLTRGLENSRQLCNSEARSRVCINFENSRNPPNVKMKLCKHGKSARKYA